MSTGGDFWIPIPCQAEGSHTVQLEMGLGRVAQDWVGDDYVEAEVRMTYRRLSFAAWPNLYGYEVGGFLENLEGMHSRLEGSAVLSDWDGEPILCLSVSHRARGRIAVGGRLIPITFSSEVQSASRFLEALRPTGGGGIVTSFDGFETDQSYLPGLVSAFRRFVGESGLRLCGHGGYTECHHR